MSIFKRIFCIFVILSISLFTGCGKNNDDSKLSDLGGVYDTSMNDMDFSIEVSGMMSDGVIEGTADSVQTLSQDSGSKLLRWGISRKPENKTPDADPGAPQLLSKYGAMYIGDTTKKRIYLTFDEGYENGYTSKILDSLKNNNAKGLFFITGPYLKEQESLVTRMVQEGHEVGNHTIHHPSLPTIDDRQIEEEVAGLERVFNEKYGKKMKYLRPPKGEYSERSLAVTKRLGYVNLFWSFAYDDWHRDKIRGPEYAYNMVMKNLHNGAVLLLHAVSKDNADALDMIIKGAKEKGYEIGDPSKIE
ncbi:MAG TPA: delta-lactam-biosynthetic de-N-acetylase [Clostridia bacterium]